MNKIDKAIKNIEKMDLGQITGLLGMLGSSTKGPFGGLVPVYGTGKRATIINTNIGGKHHMPMSKTADLMGGKKLVLVGKDKGKII